MTSSDPDEHEEAGLAVLVHLLDLTLARAQHGLPAQRLSAQAVSLGFLEKCPLKLVRGSGASWWPSRSQTTAHRPSRGLTGLAGVPGQAGELARMSHIRRDGERPGVPLRDQLVVDEQRRRRYT